MAIEIRKGSLADTEDFLELLHLAQDTMPHPEWFFLDPDDDVREMMACGSMQLWLAMDGDRVAGVFDYITPGLAPFNYGYDLGLAEEELLRVINMDSAAVHPEYRGQRLQQRLMEAVQREIAAMGSRILLCTIHPDNVYSLNNALQQGYRIMDKREKYNSVRYFLRKDVP